MIHLALQTEYSFGRCYVPIKNIPMDNKAVGIADWFGTWGHVPFEKHCMANGIKPIFGIRLIACADTLMRDRFFYKGIELILIAKNQNGLIEINELASLATSQFYYLPRLSYSDVNNISDNVIIIAGKESEFIRQDYTAETYTSKGDLAILMPEYIKKEDAVVYESMFNKKFNSRTYPQYIPTVEELVYLYGFSPIAMTRTGLVGSEIEHVKIPKAKMVRFPRKEKLIDVCNRKKYRVKKWTEEYQKRLESEIALIDEKGYTDYFFIVADLLGYAKEKMLVGPSRGSSAGSLVCFLLGITEVDPILHQLLFERFIDSNRFDLPDIDIDFQDTKRHLVIKYLRETYGAKNVKLIGTISRFKPVSTIGAMAQALDIHPGEIDDLKNSIIERSSADARSGMQVADTLNSTFQGKKIVAQYPQMLVAQHIEGHASHSGIHAAGVIVSNSPISRFGGINERKNDVDKDTSDKNTIGTLMMAMKDADYLNLLKIDCLGLRTLSILADILDAKGLPKNFFYKLDLDDEKTFQLFRDCRITGIFQFEGRALETLTRQIQVNNFKDIANLTALGRPGALNSGGANRYIKYVNGEEEPRYHGDFHKELTEESYGVVIYQEQMMEIVRKIGGFSWKDVQTLRRAASKSMGDEFFGKYMDMFLKGAVKNGFTEESATQLWKDISTSGSWSFNKSHAVSYAMISYWCAYCKANFPLEFAVASLNNASDDNHAIKLLRDMIENDNLEYMPVDPDESLANWSVFDGKLLAGFTSVKGIATATANKIIKIRNGEGKYTPALFKKVMEHKSIFDILYPCEHYFGHMYTDPTSHGLIDPPQKIGTISSEHGHYTIMGRIIDKNLRSLNEYVFIEKKMDEVEEKTGVRPSYEEVAYEEDPEHEDYVPYRYLNLTIEDDTGSILCNIRRYDMSDAEFDLAENSTVKEEWILLEGVIETDWRRIKIDNWRYLNESTGDVDNRAKRNR